MKCSDAQGGSCWNLVELKRALEDRLHLDWVLIYDLRWTRKGDPLGSSVVRKENDIAPLGGAPPEPAQSTQEAYDHQTEGKSLGAAVKGQPHLFTSCGFS